MWRNNKREFKKKKSFISYLSFFQPDMRRAKAGSNGRFKKSPRSCIQFKLNFEVSFLSFLSFLPSLILSFSLTVSFSFSFSVSPFLYLWFLFSFLYIFSFYYFFLFTFVYCFKGLLQHTAIVWILTEPLATHNQSKSLLKLSLHSARLPSAGK